MAESEQSPLMFLAKKIGEYVRAKNLMYRASNWLGFVDNEADYVVKKNREQQTEDHTLEKWSTSWFWHRIKPANKYVIGAYLLLFVLKLTGLSYYWNYLLWQFNLYPWFPTLALMLFLTWVTLRWVSRKLEVSSSALSEKLAIQARGLYWWGILVVAFQVLNTVISALWDLVF